MKPNDGDEQSAKIASRQEFEALTRPLFGGMWRTALRMTGSRDAADDLAQDACLKAYVAFAQYESGTNYKAWIFKILTNLCRDYLRRESRSPVTNWDNDEVSATVAGSLGKEGQPDMHLQQGELYADTVEALAGLSTDIRTVVCLSFFEGLTYQEIAIAEGIPIGTVRSRLSSGRRKLKGVLKAHAVSDDGQADQDVGRAPGNLSTVKPVMAFQSSRTELLK